MGTDAFVIPQGEVGPQDFAVRFLNSSDFTQQLLKEIGQKLGIYTSSKKEYLSQNIASAVDQGSQTFAKETIIDHLFARPLKWVSFKTGWIADFPHLDDPQELIIAPGKEKWYGPVTSHSDDIHARWYVRPVFVDHMVALEGAMRTLVPSKIRWLCFARLTRHIVSLHWQGFSLQDTVGSNSQFSYWNYIPGLFDEIEKLTKSRLRFPDLHKLVLHDIWDKYRGSPDYKWTDRRIRAESSGVNLSAYAGVLEFDAGGIYNLAQVIRKSIQQELVSRYEVQLPDPRGFDEIILRTLIRGYGALSYEFQLDRDSEALFRAHTYFGHKKQSGTADSFPHINFHISHRSPLEQLEFLVDHMTEDSAHYEESKPEVPPLFQGLWNSK